MYQFDTGGLPKSSAFDGDGFMGRTPRLPFASTAQLLSRHAGLHPDKTALFDITQDKGIDYRSLRDRVTRLAGTLAAIGVKSADRVILLGKESIEKLVVWLAVWRAGGCVCALDVEANGPFLERIVSLLGVTTILYDDDLKGSPLIAALGTVRYAFGKCYGEALTTDSLFGLSYAEYSDPPPDRTHANDIASIFCTSGTTGSPKIVFTDHVSMWLCGLEATGAMALGPNDQTLEYRSFSWTSPQSTSLMPWLQNGLTLNIAARFSSSRFFDWIAERQITFVACVPTVINMLLERGGTVSSAQLRSIKRMSCSTAPLSIAQWERFEETYGVPLLQYCGMSEAGFVAANRHDRRKIGTVGLPAEYQDLQILDADGHPCPANVQGELSVCGPETAVGVVSLDGTYQPIKGTRLHTGDLGVMDEDGFIRITGRLKDVIIRGGINISPTEIDQLLYSHKNIADAATIGVPDRIYGEEVVAFVVLRAGTHLVEQEIIDFCVARLPSSKAPKRVYMIDQLPRSPRGKLLKDSLLHHWQALSADS